MADGSLQAMTDVDARDIAAALGMHKRNIEKRAHRESWPFTERAARGGKRRLYAVAKLPQDVQAALLLKQAPPPAPARDAENAQERIKSLWQRYEAAPDTFKRQAQRRLKALQAVEQLVASGQRLGDARAAIAAQLQREGERGGSAASLGRWAADVQGLHRADWLAALLPAYTGRTAQTDIPAEAWDLFKADYLRLEAPAASACFGRLQRIAKVKQWGELPCLRTFERRIASEIPRGVLILMREGEEALARTFPAQERDRTIFHALEAVNADGHKFDVFVRTPMGDIVRPILVGVQDLYSGKIVGYRLAETESADLIRLAFRNVVESHGIPRKVWFDNGRGFASKLITGGVANRFRFKVKPEDPVGIVTSMVDEIHWAQPYHGQAKPIERAWRDLCETIARHPACAGAYTGNKPDAKPENYGSKAIDWEVFVNVVREEIGAHNARTKRRTRVCGGTLSFDQAFAASYAQSTIKKATAEQLRQLLLAAEAVTANQYDGSVRLNGNRYWCSALAEHAGRKVMLRFDPDALHAPVSVYALNNAFIGDAECVAAVGFADTNAAREHTRARKDFIRSTKKQAKAQVRMDAARVAAQIPQAAPESLPPAAVVAPIFGAGHKPRAPEATAPELQRTGTDDAPQAALGDLLKRMQKQRNDALGFDPER